MWHRALAFGGLVTLLSVGAARAASPSIVDDLKHLCMDTHGVPSAAYAAAEAVGWQNEPGLADTFAKVSGDPTGRVLMTDGRPVRMITVAARPLPNGVPDNRCVLLGPSDFGQTTASVKDLLKLGPSAESATNVTWNVSTLDGVLRRSEDYAPKELFQPGRHGPSLTIQVVAVQNGVAVAYRELGTERIIAPPPPLPPDAGDVTRFKAWVEQDGRHQPLAGQVHLKKAPFVIVLEGSHVLSYSVASSVDPAAFAGKTSQADLEAVFSPLSVGAEGERDHDLVVNLPMTDARSRLTVHSWFDGLAGRHRFTGYVVDAKGVATARREVDDFFVKPSRQSVPLDQWDGRPVYLLITGRPPMAGFPHEDPKAAELVFE